METVHPSLKNRWSGHTQELQELIPIIQGNPDWHLSQVYLNLMAKLGPLPLGISSVEKDLRGANLSGADLEGVNLSGLDLTGVDLSGAFLERATSLSGAFLWRINLSGADLRGANLSRAFLAAADLSGADLKEANLSRADLERATSLSGAFLWRINLSGANLRWANLSKADLGAADLSGADLLEANLSEANLRGVIYTTDEIFNRLTKGRRFRITNFESVDTSKINGSTNPVLKRHIEDYQFILGFKGKTFSHRYLFYPLWKAMSDCGRSLMLWLLWSLGFVGLFTAIYSRHSDWFTTTTTKPINLDWFNILYFNVVTFTTLGFGDISAKLDNRYAQGLVMAEVIIGYIMLGGLVSILANKLARRA